MGGEDAGSPGPEGPPRPAHPAMTRFEEVRFLAAERHRVVGYVLELFALTFLEFSLGLATWTLVYSPLSAIAAALPMLLSWASLFLAVIAAAAYESIRPRGDEAIEIAAALKMGRRVRLCIVLAYAVFAVVASVLLFASLFSPFPSTNRLIVAAVILCLVGVRLVFGARSYQAARAKELAGRD